MFISIRKQKKRMQEMQEMQNDVAVGSRLQLTSGLFGTVADADNSDYIDVEIATGVVTRWNRLAIMRVVQTEDAAETYPGAPSSSSYLGVSAMMTMTSSPTTTWTRTTPSDTESSSKPDLEK